MDATELREAAEEFLTLPYTDEKFRAVMRAYLAAQPAAADDAEPVSEGWVYATGAFDNQSNIWLSAELPDGRGNLVVTVLSDRVSVTLENNYGAQCDDPNDDRGEFDLGDIANRGQLRRLCAALGIELKEPHR